jgi:hypothetical protein
MSDGGRVSTPAASQPIPGLPSSPAHVDFEHFAGIDTKTPRPALKDEVMAWCSGFMPVGPSELRILPGIGPVVFNSGDLNIVWHGYGNIGDTPYALILLSDGGLGAVRTTDGFVVGSILPAGTVVNPRDILGFAQWGSEYLIFANDQTDGYWLWDGTNAFMPGTAGPIVNVTDGGKDYTSEPVVTLHTTGAGTGVAISTELDGDAVSRVTVTAPGSGFVKGDFVILTFSGGGSDDTATAVADLSAGGGITSIEVIAGGSAYTYATTVTATSGSGSGASLAPVISNGVLIGVTVINPGHDYTEPPTLTVVDPGYGSGSAHIAGGTGANVVAFTGTNGLHFIDVGYGGTGYTSVPTVEIVGDGSGAEAKATIAGGIVTEIVVTNPGQGYSKALVRVLGGNDAAAAEIALMPYGISGTAVEVFQSRVWVSNGAARADFPPRARLIWSDVETPVDFGPSGGALVGNDSFLRVGWHRLIQTNGYLYLIGDSSVNVIGQVTTETVGAVAASATTSAIPGVLTTVFQNQNTDPQIGSPWPSSVQVFSRNILMANSQGIHALYGGAVSKVSDPLDGIYFNASILGAGHNFSSAVCQIFGIQVYCLLIPFTDPLSGAVNTNLLMYDQKKFWTSPQDVALSYIATQEFNSEMTAWGTDGKNLFRLFQTPSTAFPKVIRSKLWANPGYDFTKTAVRLYGILQKFPLGYPLSVYIENETEIDNVLIALDSVSATGISILGPIRSGSRAA